MPRPSTISLEGTHGEVYAVFSTSTPGEVIATGETAVINNTNYTEVYEPESGTTGYVETAVLSELDVATVQIPSNFADLEAVSTPTRMRYQLFEVIEVTQNDEYVEVVALHIFYELRQDYTLWAATAGTQYTAAAACRNILTNAITGLNFRVASDCKDKLYGTEMDYARKNIVECFLDPESGLCAKYGLSLIRDNKNFYCLKNVGYDRGLVIETGRNLMGIERCTSIENLITRVAPVGRDENGDLVWLNYNSRKYVDSDNIQNYRTQKLEIYYTGLTVGEDGVTAGNINDKLLAAARKRFSDDHVDTPEVTLTIEFVSLGDTIEYSKYKDLDKVYLFDIITVKDTMRGWTYTAQVTGVEHDVLTGRLNSVTIDSLNKVNRKKISKWDVPEVSGGKIRRKSIEAGAYAPKSIHQGDLSDDLIAYIRTL